MENTDLVFLETKACILQILYTRQAAKSPTEFARVSPSPLFVEDIVEHIPGRDRDQIESAISELVEDDECPVEYADRRESEIWLTDANRAVELTKEMRMSIYENI